jgi:serine protease Do
MRRLSDVARRCAVLATTLWLCLAAAAPAHAETPALSAAQIAERAIPSVVLIKVARGLGSGFIAGPDGRIVTNLHVIVGSSEVTVVLSDGREFSDVEIMGVDQRQDLALLRISAKNLPPALPLGDSSKVKPGERVVAIGNPLGLGNTVSDGLVSGLREIAPTLNVIQISAPLSPGSSGGPLFNERGEVIGISRLIFTEGQNLNFGVPVNSLKPMLAITQGTPLASWKPSGVPQRSVPHHNLSLLSGCTNDHLGFIMKGLSKAIELGAPLYNDGNQEACFRIYEAAALEVGRKLAGCPGPRRALLEGVHKSETLSSYDAKAWAMRDAFDGVIDVIGRRVLASERVPAADTSKGPTRAVPNHPVSVLKGCSPENMTRVTGAINGAIEVGGTLYDEGNHEACVRIYEGAILELEGKLAGCSGIKRALATGRHEAGRRSGFSDKAWALRDAFDGVLDVISRASHSEGAAHTH